MPFQQFDYSAIDHRAWPVQQRISRRIFVFLMRLLIRLEVEDIEHIPETGAFVLAANHLHMLDPALGLICVPRHMVGMIKDKWRRPPFNWFLAGMSDIIFVGNSNRHALFQAIKVLEAGGVMVVLPEGTRSPTGALGKGHVGAAFLATRAPAPVLPAVIYGQEQAMKYWKRLRRVPVYARIGTLIELPPGKADREQLETFTEQIMIAIARLLPPGYRGIYAELGGSSGVDNMLS